MRASPCDLRRGLTTANREADLCRGLDGRIERSPLGPVSDFCGGAPQQTREPPAGRLVQWRLTLVVTASEDGTARVGVRAPGTLSDPGRVPRASRDASVRLTAAAADVTPGSSSGPSLS